MQFAGLAVKNPVSSMILPHSAPRRRAWPERTASLLLPGAYSRPAPAAPRRRSSRRGGLYGRPDRTPTTTRAPGHRGPATAACGHAALRGSAGVRWKSPACSGGHKGRPYDVPSAWSVGRGAHTPPKQAAGITGLAVIAARSWRHVGMPPYARSGRRTALHTGPAGRCGYRPLRAYASTTC